MLQIDENLKFFRSYYDNQLSIELVTSNINLSTNFSIFF